MKKNLRKATQDYYQQQQLDDKSLQKIQEMLDEMRVSGCLEGVQVRIVTEDKPMGTGGAVLNAIDKLHLDDSFLVMNADTWLGTGVNLINDLGAPSLAAVKVKHSERYGSVIIKNGKVKSFLEKGDKGSSWINNGHYIFNKNQFINYKYPFSLEKILIPQLVNQNQLGIYKVYNDNFIDMGVPDDYKNLCDKYEEIK